ncbi:MAG: hypothetical protein IJM90_03755 [Firmicutes bacterium]|nr:hypothetical protein [Bacillota bacterium]
MKKILPIIAVILMMALASCSGGGEESKSGSDSQASAPAETYEIVLKNGADAVLKEFSFGGKNLLAADLAAGAELKVTVSGGKGDVKVVFDGADPMTLHIFPVNDMQQATVCRDEKTVYLTYVNLKGALQNTKNDEAAYVPEQTESSAPEESMYIPPVDGDPSMPDDIGGGCINDSGLFG